MTITTIAQVSACLRGLLGPQAEQIARETGLVQRRSKLTGAKFVQALTFGWLAHPDATREQLAQSAADVDVAITAPGLYQRMSRAGATCLRRVLEAALQQVVRSEPLAIPLLQRFTGVEIQDSTVIALPAELADEWLGGSGPAALKVQTRWDYLHGTLHLDLRPGREHDLKTPLADDLEAGALRLTDLGYFQLERLKHDHERQIYWVSRVRLPTCFYLESRQLQALGLPDDPTRTWTVLDLVQAGDPLTRRPEGWDLRVTMGAQQRIPCRLLVQRVDPLVAAQRRQDLREDARRKAQPVSETQLALADWTILVTNLLLEQLSLREAFVLYRVRWQIELLFKLWKMHGKIDEWRSTKPEAILCEVYAKLLAMLIQHWVILVCGFAFANRSLVKAAQTVRDCAAQIAAELPDAKRCQRVLQRIARRLAAGCRMNPRAKHPNLYQRLLALQPPEAA